MASTYNHWLNFADFSKTKAAPERSPEVEKVVEETPEALRFRQLWEKVSSVSYIGLKFTSGHAERRDLRRFFALCGRMM